MQYIFNIFMTLLEGAKTASILFIVVILLSLPLGFLFTLMARSSIAPIRWFANAYIYILRGTPLLLQLIFIFFGVPYLPVIGKYLVFERFTAALIGFVLNYAAYFAEIFRGGLLAVDKGQYEAAKVLGMSRFKATVFVILPQMIRVALPSVTNEAVSLVKDTSLLYAVAVPEIIHYATGIVNRDFNVTAFAVAAAIYLVMNTLLSFLFKKLEKKLEY